MNSMIPVNSYFEILDILGRALNCALSLPIAIGTGKAL